MNAKDFFKQAHDALNGVYGAVDSVTSGLVMAAEDALDKWEARYDELVAANAPVEDEEPSQEHKAQEVWNFISKNLGSWASQKWNPNSPLFNVTNKDLNQAYDSLVEDGYIVK